MPYNEADTRANLIDPKLRAAGWGESRIEREHYFKRNHQLTLGRIYLVGDEARRREPMKADYLLRYSDVLPIAVIEAKPEDDSPGAGIQQAKTYAEVLDLLFAYSTNGHSFVEFDYTTNTQREIASFPSPDELWRRYTSFRTHIVQGGRNPYLYPYCPASQCGKELRYFQEVAINRTIRHIMQGQRRLLLAMATGSGKTFVAFQLVWKLVKSGWFRRVLFVTDRVFLRDNAYNTFGSFEDARYVIEEGKVNLNRDIYFAMYQTIWNEKDGKRLFECYPSDFFDLIIIDECHRSGYGTWNEILQYFPKAIQLGMTATPKRTDNIDTYNYFCKESNDKPIYSYSFGQGIEDGFLATYKVHRVRTNVDKSGLHMQDAMSQGAEIFVPDGAELKEVYFTPQFEREITLPDRIEKMCDHLAGLLKTFGPMEKTMVFCVDIVHAEKVVGHLQNHFGHLGYSNYAVRIVAEEPNAKEIFEQFQDSEKTVPTVATTADLLTTGVDVPSVKNIVFMKTVSSPVVFKQIVGRGSRTDSTTNKLWFRIIDYTNATRLFDDWDRPPIPPPPLPTGPRNCRIEGKVIEKILEGDVEISGNPIYDAKVTVLCSPNEQVQQRTDDDGNFTFDKLPEGSLKVIVSATGYKQRTVVVETTAETTQKILIELPKKVEPIGKIRVKGLEVVIADETTFIIERTGQQLSLREYIDYSKNEVLRQSPDIEHLREIWIDPGKRSTFLSVLIEASIHIEVLAEVLEQPEADQFDILSYIAFGKSAHTRRERAEAFINREQPFINSHRDEAKEVILNLLDKYRVGGIEELTRPEIFRLPPFDKMGFAPGVIKRFGDVDTLRKTLNDVQSKLYPVEEVT